MAQCVSKQDAISADERKRGFPPLSPKRGRGSRNAASPPSNELALDPHVPADPKEKSATRDARTKAAAWLGDHKPTDTTQAAAYRLLAKVRAGTPAKTLQQEIDLLMGR